MLFILKNNAGQVRSGWIILIGFIAVLIAQSIFTVPGMAMLANAIDTESLELSTAELMLMLDAYPWVFLFVQAGGTIGGVIATVLLWRFLNKKSLYELGFRSSLSDLTFGLILGALSITLIFLILLATENISLVNSILDPEFSIYTFTFLIIFITVAFFEEMFFRGYVMMTMANRGNKKWVIYAVSALFFSIVHGGNPNVSMLGLINIALVGILFAYMFDVTQSLWLPIGYHLTWNYFQGNVFGFAVSGLKPHGIYQVDASGGSDLITGGAFGIEGGLMATLLIVFGFFATKVYHSIKSNKSSSFK